MGVFCHARRLNLFSFVTIVCVILPFFTSYSVLDRVLSRTHNLDGRVLEVKRYLECLGEHGGSPDPKAFTIPEPVVLEGINKYKLDFLSQSQTVFVELRGQLSTLHAKPALDLESGKLTIECSLTQEVPKARILAKTWHTDVDEAMQTYLGLMEVHTRKVLQQIWEKVEKAMKMSDITNMKEAIVLTLSKETAFVVVGMTGDAQKLYEKVHSIAKAVEDEIERKKQEITERKKLKPFQLQLLSSITFPAEMIKLHENLKVEMLKDEILFHGSMTDVQHAQLEMYKHLENVKEKSMPMKSQEKLDMISNFETKEYLSQKLEAEGLKVSWDIDPKQGVILHAFDENDLLKAVSVIDSSVCEHKIDLHPESAELPQYMEWKQMIQQLAASKPGSLRVHPSANNTISIIGTDNIFSVAKEKISKFLYVHTIFTEVVFFSPSRQKFISSFLEDRLRKIERNLQSHKVQINFIDSNSKIEVKGRHEGLQKAKLALENLGGKIVCDALNVNDSAGIMFLETDSCLRDLEGVALRERCVFSFVVEESGMQVIITIIITLIMDISSQANNAHFFFFFFNWPAD